MSDMKLSDLTDLEDMAESIIKERKVTVGVDGNDMELSGVEAVAFASGVLFACKSLSWVEK